VMRNLLLFSWVSRLLWCRCVWICLVICMSSLLFVVCLCLLLIGLKLFRLMKSIVRLFLVSWVF